MPNHSQKQDALKSLYEGQLGAIKTLSERSFSTTMQALTLNVVVVAGLMAGKVKLSIDGKIIGTFLIVIFNMFVALYLVSKSRAHHREKVKFVEVQNSLAEICDLSTVFIEHNNISFWKSFLGGTGIFIFCVVVTCLCSISAIWFQLLVT